MRNIKASEIGTYIYCRRAWWYQLKGYTPENQDAMMRGKVLHHRHGQRLILAGLMRWLAYLCILAAMLLIISALV